MDVAGTSATTGIAPDRNDPGLRWGEGQSGVLAGIALKPYAKAPMQVLDRSEVTTDGGILGDYRGRLKPGGTGKRQVTLFERRDWEAALAEVDAAAPWWARRCNLMVDGLDLPQQPGARLRLGRDVVLEVTVECDPCVRMEAVAPGLFAALVPDWRAGACARVVTPGIVTLGDVIRIEGR